ncbi:bifunctional diguanylate cyclase/phosphodiesterase [Salinihabitans flavidus]|uniref:bifunctional diguanylate cyclase/phosphodiesterase n=1 Tax=Salinihabitans flavidus TaxID=569882 RepID=UPI002481A3E8|nr:EAL domain-containing protein [Salinihabitans flavidus]
MDLARCEWEPIATPGAIQPHGALLTVVYDNGLIAHASANLEEVLGSTPASVLGQPIEKVIGSVSEIVQREILLPGSQPLQSSVQLRDPKGIPLQLHAFRSGRYVCIDIEAVHPTEERRHVGLAQSIIESFSAALTQNDLCKLAVRGLKEVTGYDRVMAYRFGEGGHGEVIAELCNPGIESYLGLRYPASDIPQIARALYLRQRVGSIGNSSYEPVPLFGHPELDDGVPLDLTHSNLRSVSPIHREYMRNMQTAASLTIGLADGERLWGMLVCHHSTPKVPEPEQRSNAGTIGQVVSLMLSSLGEAETARQKLKRQATLSVLVERLATQDTLTEAFAGASAELLELVDATGALVRLSGNVLRLGILPPPRVIERALAMAMPSSDADPLGVDDLGLRHPDLASCVADGSGVLVLPLASGGDDLIAWFRPEQHRTITWGGSPIDHATWDPAEGRMHPRASFATWKETVSGRSSSWTSADVSLALALRQEVAAEMAMRTSAELAKLRYYDPLTGLANRSLLQEELTALQTTSGPGASLLFLDLDGFKAVNDSMGHDIGDGLLIAVAQRLVNAVRPDDLVVRLGGDEFVVLCQGVDLVATKGLGERLRQVIDEPFEIAGHWCHVSASIGIADTFMLGDLDLVQAADIAMYAAKQDGGNRSQLFAPGLHEIAAQQVTFNHDLREALADDQFVLVYQPVFTLKPDGDVLNGFEALLRWEHPKNGTLSPDRFIPIAEKLGHIHPIGDWVLATAIRQALSFRTICPDLDLTIYVNVSPLQLAHPELVAGMREILQSVPTFPPQALCVEVTESFASDTIVVDALAEIRALGVRVAIDDFGTGFSSLSNLRRLPADKVKFDGTFLSELTTNGKSEGFFSILNQLIHSTNMTVVQEGIETQEQLDFVRAAGADMAQGFFLSLPLTVEDATQLTHEHGRRLLLK